MIITSTLDLELKEAEACVREKLEKEGFGVLTETDVKATLDKKLYADFRPCKIRSTYIPLYVHSTVSPVNEATCQPIGPKSFRP